MRPRQPAEHRSRQPGPGPGGRPARLPVGVFVHMPAALCYLIGSRFDGGELSPGPEVRTDEEILDWVARDAETALHPCGTAAMGTGDMSVVDPGSMRVHGIEGLRVVDASVMPLITNANIYAGHDDRRPGIRRDPRELAATRRIGTGTREAARLRPPHESREFASPGNPAGYPPTA